MRGARSATRQSLPNTKRRSFYRDCRVARRAPRNDHRQQRHLSTSCARTT
ncbi:MAG: hypothetical protein LBL66_03870 [Clostridiales bacterium]|nr:hypothetical protein [Clostridiales bacterium]